MIIQINAGNKVTATQEFTAAISATIADELKRFSEHITRIEVHLGDEDGDKKGDNDKRCTMEARLEGMKPIAVTNHANTHEQAVDGAIDKLKTSLNTIIGRLREH